MADRPAKDQFTKSSDNRIVEKAGLQDVLLQDPRFQAPTTGTKKAILKGLGLGDTKLYGPQSFDAIMLPQVTERIDEPHYLVTSIKSS